MNVLTIGGSDPSSGAGIQSDIKTFDALGCYGFSVITAITSQNTSRFSNVEPISPKMLSSQIDSVLSDFKINSVKIGMVFNSSIIKAIHKKISKLSIPIVVDPVIKSTTGGTLLQQKSISDYKKFMIPIATIITPNTYELEILSNVKIKNKEDVNHAVNILKKFGVKNVIVTGIEKHGKILDYIYLENKEFVMNDKKISKQNHGSGCNYSAALISSLAKGNNLIQSIYAAKKFTYDSIKNSIKIGKGIEITNNKIPNENELKLKKSINDFTMEKKIWKFIPECQTNFVFSKKRPKSTKDILGLDGRIIKAGTKVIVAGELNMGGSKHVASAVLQMNKKFPSILSGINIKYEQKIVEQIKKKGLKIQNYDRRNEPKSIKNKENSSITWGIKYAIKNAKSPYDAIYHKGDFGKEAMIIIFGEDPDDVMKKISMIV